MVNGAPAWESRASYTTSLITSLNEMTAAHEFGHALGLDHNFMGSVDQRNFPVDAKGNIIYYSSSIMDYNQYISDAFFETTSGTPVWGSYDVAATGVDLQATALSTPLVGAVDATAVPSARR